MRVGRALAFAAAVSAAALGVSSGARADGLTSDESTRLVRGDVVTRTQQLDRGPRHYVGGVSYAIVDATPAELAALVDDVSAWRRILPRTREARRIGTDGGDVLAEITHGSLFVSVGYTMRLHREGNEVRFWLDRTRPHDIDDAWGYIRSQPMADGRTLVTWAILVDMGNGMLRDMFESKVQQMALTVPERVKDVMVERTSRGRRASR
ncbi:MAG TPA: SRPBCC family protein [Polyangiaceae bacterium]|nr:SRPBCC family protein [Polyangiaceae bacterium]